MEKPLLIDSIQGLGEQTNPFLFESAVFLKHYSQLPHIIPPPKRQSVVSITHNAFQNRELCRNVARSKEQLGSYELQLRVEAMGCSQKSVGSRFTNLK